VKKVNITTKDRKRAKKDATNALTMKVKKKARTEGKELDDSELSDFIASCCYVRTIPRNVVDEDDVMEVDVTSMAVKGLLDVEHHFCHDSGSASDSAAGTSTKRDDFVWFDESEAAKKSVHVRGPSVGAPGCEGRGPLVCRVEKNGVPHGLIDPEGVGAAAEMNFRVTSSQLFKKRGARVVSGKFNEPDVLECVRTGEQIDMVTDESILVMETKGAAADIEDSPEFRKLVEDVKQEKRSPLVNLTPHLKGGGDGQAENSTWANMSKTSFLTKFLLLTATVIPSPIPEPPAANPFAAGNTTTGLSVPTASNPPPSLLPSNPCQCPPQGFSHSVRQRSFGDPFPRLRLPLHLPPLFLP
jgi:hypothetical protein